ncbi:MAG: UDP-N-acetylmuramate dehydrogenase [Verrucomicrobia bacterium]|nr:UDP-N-acetylmuramate dehydrogenase [Verrucomicrobiota bacterium]MCH8513867.1 UDP-N-acetylmuramate dehydrogenase [Kiritimatiellia bacterium]
MLLSALQNLADPDIHIRENVPLRDCGTFQIGGPARYVVDCHTPSALGKVREISRIHDVRPVLLGGGSNVLFSDEGWPGWIVRYTSSICEPEPIGAHRWRVSAAADLDALAAWACANGQAGLEAFTGIPGTIGGGVAGNAGAWGVQLEHVLDRIHGWTPEGEKTTWQVSDCHFEYRDSRLKHDGSWIGEIEFRTHPGDSLTLGSKRKEILSLRAEKHPDWRQTPCIGSFFKNLEPTSAAERRQAAGWFLETSGAKAERVGGAAVFERHANILIKVAESCTAADVAELARRLQKQVKAVHGHSLQREIRYLGVIPGETDCFHTFH